MMTEREASLDRSYFLNILKYEPETGVFRWNNYRNSRGGPVGPGVIAGTIDRNGHRIITVDGWRYMAHRLAWFYVHGEWPSGQVDHANMVHDDNRIDNLRVATRTQQRANQHVRSDSSTGIKGVRLKRGRFHARIRIKGFALTKDSIKQGRYLDQFKAGVPKLREIVDDNPTATGLTII